MSRVGANALLMLVALIWGSAFVAQNQGMTHIGPLLFTGLRFLIGAVVVLPLMVLEWLRRDASLPALGPADALRVVAMGTLLLLGAALQQIGIVTTTVTNAGFLTALYVPMVPLAGWLLFRHRPHLSVWPAALACVWGAYLLSGAQGLHIKGGDAWVIASTLPWALHVLLVGRLAARMHSQYLVAGGQFIVCGVLALIGAWLFEPASWAAIHAARWSLLYAGVLSVGVAFTAQVVALRYAAPSDAAIVLSAETLFAALFGYIFLGDRLDSAGWLGSVLIFSSMSSVQLMPIMQSLRRKRVPA